MGGIVASESSERGKGIIAWHSPGHGNDTLVQSIVKETANNDSQKKGTLDCRKDGPKKLHES